MHSVSETDAHVLGCEPGFRVVSCCSRHTRVTTRTQQTLMLLIISELMQNRYGFLNISTNYTYKFLIHILFWFVLLITTSQSAGVLHVPACNHDSPPMPGSTFMYMRCVPHNIPYWLCLSPPPKPSCRWCKMIYCTSIMKENRYLKISTFMWTQAYS